MVIINTAATAATFVIFLRLSFIYPTILYFIHPFDTQEDGELSLSWVDDYVVVR